MYVKYKKGASPRAATRNPSSLLSVALGWYFLACLCFIGYVVSICRFEHEHKLSFL